MLDTLAHVPLAPFTTLRAGGPAERLIVVHTASELAEAAKLSQLVGEPLTVLGHGSNVLPSDAGVPGTVLVNRSKELCIEPDGTVTADSGIALQDLFLKTVQHGLTGLEFAVGIPGTLGGALASNAGAYRSSIGSHVTAVEVVEGGRVRWESADFLRFSYRHSILREEQGRRIVVTRVRLRLQPGDSWRALCDAREFQRQRILKQPPPASAGSFFKNVQDPDLARNLPNLPLALREAGVVPAGFLLEAVGMRGFRHGGAMFSHRHANFVLNVARATAGEIRELTEIAKQRVLERFGKRLEEEVLLIGRWA
ncbi:MAG: UDP-N-acetylmuramate dehydrogenase [Fimbriimonadales bacterium]|nr:UDP-N-acetylmuramate dehydrogenase [Fimbriimonadales bacterium]